MATLEFERKVVTSTGNSRIAGLDEAGRGALAGPVVAAAVMLRLNDQARLDVLGQVNDSKRLSAKTRDQLFPLIVKYALAYGIGSVDAAVIDEIGIIPATKRAMAIALSQIDPAAEYLLIDGRIRLKSLPVRQQSIIRGDGKSLSIAAASILAKVTRDQHMVALDDRYPEYGFARHKGYGTKFHLDALARHGPSQIHRRSFAPLREQLL